MSATPFIGQIEAFAFNFAPRGWAVCQGQLLSISQNDALFSLLGTTFGGDGRTTFGLPDLRGRTLRHVGNGPGLTNIRAGEKAGRDSLALTTVEMPQHNHSFNQKLNASSDVGDLSSPSGNFVASNEGAYNEDPGSENLGDEKTMNVGSSNSISIQNPYLGMYVCIALVGVYPSRS